ncbi:S8 family serine peptidase [Nocardia sp. CDC186]|uniref:S8 family serine peptidase n=1 Tax=Nocardia implantans TaxID=3108168 RepID=A0ABU6AY77_9NOCA|nr:MULTISPECIES: S8 family serine peptidase [unclassified Nocardia]MBF6193756.1 S8 family serine peptidase [Nocardia beijingensis]MEA3529508.1 S8 family serine peptidase [Nocardia sp. CDC192]MEB3512094.1 S8 family serine peptidase [Nocardia sp. CDC186]
MASQQSELRSPAELVVVTHGTGTAITPIALSDSRSAQARLTELLPAGGELVRIFGPANRLERRLTATPYRETGAEYLRYFYVRGVTGRLDELAARLRTAEDVAAAYVKPPAEPPIAPEGARAITGRSAAEAPPVTPDFTVRQGYLDAAPQGIDARWAWTVRGGRGTGVRVVDVEGAWRFTHEDLQVNQGGVIGGSPSPQQGWRDHGTAVAGVISGDVNAYGITGIVPEAHIRAVSIFGSGSASAIRSAADALGPGDVMLLELHRPGPRFDYANRPDQRGYIAVEWWPDDFAAIRYAVGRGIVVVEAGGNGGEDLDAALYDARPAEFPSIWRNPFRGGDADSGAIIVGAGAPPPGFHGRDNGPARSRLPFSNYGERIDVQGWGLEVTTTGYGDLQGGPDEDLWYTDVFSGTSSASPIVVGAVTSYQGMSAAAAGRKTPAEVRARLRETGTPQTDAPDRPASQRIGNLPDLKSMILPR